jgi:LuxR family maltose regulon positive regulatory protein
VAGPKPAAWLSLNENDDDPTRFLLYLIAALQTQQPDLGRQVQELLDNKVSGFSASRRELRFRTRNR